jgi:hypothetical protein
MSPENEKDLGFLLNVFKGIVLWYTLPFILIVIVIAGLFVDAIIYGIVKNILIYYHMLVHYINLY